MLICRLMAIPMLWLLACQPAKPHDLAPPPPLAATPYLDSQAGFSVDVPDDWDQEDVGITQIFHGPKNSDAYFATLAIQRRPALGSVRLDESVAHALAALSQAPGFSWDTLELNYVGEDLALGYRVRFTALEIDHCQNGWVLVHNDTLIGITLSAPAASCAFVAPVFQMAVDSLVTFSLPNQLNPHPLRTPHDPRSRR